MGCSSPPWALPSSDRKAPRPEGRFVDMVFPGLTGRQKHPNNAYLIIHFSGFHNMFSLGRDKTFCKCSAEPKMLHPWNDTGSHLFAHGKLRVWAFILPPRIKPRKLRRMVWNSRMHPFVCTHDNGTVFFKRKGFDLNGWICVRLPSF